MKLRWKFWEEVQKSFQQLIDEFWKEFKPMEAAKEALAILIFVPFFIGFYLSADMIKQLVQIGWTVPDGVLGLRAETIFVAAAMGIGISASGAFWALWRMENQKFSEKANFIGFPIVVLRLNGTRITTDKRFGDVTQVFPTRRKVRIFRGDGGGVTSE